METVRAAIVGSARARVERVLLLVAPALAMTAVALGLGFGARSDERAAVVYGAPPSAAGTGLAWQVATFREVHGAREPLALTQVVVVARPEKDGAPEPEDEVRWTGATNEDGMAEMLLPLPPTPAVELEVRSGGALLARGRAQIESGPRAPRLPAWAPFARREGAVVLDVAVVGQRVASGFPASLWVRATDATTHAALAGVTVTPESDGALSSAPGGALTDGRGWASVVATPMGHAVALIVHARAQDGRTGDWAGALFVSPGAAGLTASDRYAPDEQPAFDVVAPNLRTTSYVEIDDARGRAWGAIVPLATQEGAMPRASVRAPRLAAGLYWVLASSDPMGAALLGPGTIARPFFVAASDDAALAMGPDPETCAAPHTTLEAGHALGPCLALAGASTVARWVALEGFAEQHAHDRRKAAAGLAVALGSIGIAVVLETILLMRAWHSARAGLRAATTGEGADAAVGVQMERAGNVVVALLVALLGFGLLAALLVRTG